MSQILTPQRELITDGLLVWLRLDENTGSTATDSSGNGNNSTIVGSPSWISGGSPVSGGYGLELSGTGQYITLTSAVIRNPPVSLMAWIRLDTNSVNNGGFFSIADVNTANRFFMVFIATNVTSLLTNEVIVITHDDGTYVPNESCVLGYTTTNSEEIFDNKWHHVAIVSDGSAWAIYLDGASKTVTVGRKTNNGKYNVPSANAARFGCRSINGNLNTLPLDGGVDDFRFYSRALTANEVAAIAVGRG